MRSGSFYPARRFLRDSCVRYHRVQHSLNAETVEGRDAGRKNAMRKRRKGEKGLRGGRAKGRMREGREEEDEESRTSPPRGMGLPRHSLGAGIMKSSSWGTSWLYFAGVRRRRRVSCNGKILNSPATRRGASTVGTEVRGIARTFHPWRSAIVILALEWRPRLCENFSLYLIEPVRRSLEYAL